MRSEAGMTPADERSDVAREVDIYDVRTALELSEGLLH